jgi:hypothetical protein
MTDVCVGRVTVCAEMEVLLSHWERETIVIPDNVKSELMSGIVMNNTNIYNGIVSWFI